MHFIVFWMSQDAIKNWKASHICSHRCDGSLFDLMYRAKSSREEGSPTFAHRREGVNEGSSILIIWGGGPSFLMLVKERGDPDLSPCSCLLILTNQHSSFLCVHLCPGHLWQGQVLDLKHPTKYHANVISFPVFVPLEGLEVPAGGGTLGVDGRLWKGGTPWNS